MHRSISVKSAQYLDEMRRHNYVTPTAYLELIKMIKMVMEMRQKQVTEKRNRLSVGLDKLNTTKTEVAVLQKNLAEQQPVLERTTKAVGEQQVQIAKDKDEATVVAAEATKATAEANTIAAECKEIKESAEADLAKARHQPPFHIHADPPARSRPLAPSPTLPLHLVAPRRCPRSTPPSSASRSSTSRRSSRSRRSRSRRPACG